MRKTHRLKVLRWIGKPGLSHGGESCLKSKLASLRSLSATRLSRAAALRLNGFVSLPHGRFTFIGAIAALKEHALDNAQPQYKRCWLLFVNLLDFAGKTSRLLGHDAVCLDENGI